MAYKEGSIVSLKNRTGIFVIEQVPSDSTRLYVLYRYNDKYHLISEPESNILPMLPNCWHHWLIIDIGLGVKQEIRYCTNCGIKFDDLERTKLNEKKD